MLCQELRRLAAGIFTFALLLSSCSDKNPESLSEYITEETSVASIVNLDELCRKAGEPLRAGKQLDAVQADILSLATFSTMTDVIAPLVDAGAIDPKEIMLVKVNDNSKAVMTTSTIAAVRVVDEDALEKVINGDGYTAAAVRKSSFCFLTENKGAVEKFLAEVETEAPAALISVKEALNAEGAIRGVLHTQAELAGKNAEWVTVAVKVNDDVISAEAGAIDKEGNTVNFGECFDEMAPSVLSFIPSDAVVAAAFGKPTIEIPGLDKILGSYTGISAWEISGTSAFSLGLAGSVDNLRSVGPEAFNIQFVTAADGRRAENLVEQAKMRYLSEEFIDGQHVADLFGCDLYFTNTQGYFAQSLNRPVSATYSNDLAPWFEGKRLALMLNIPYGGPLMKSLNLPAGVSLNFALSKDNMKMRLRFNGTDKPAIVTLLEVNRDLVEFIGASPALLL